jgi:hypothetical protein
MIAGLADNQRTDEPRTSDAFLNWLVRQRRHRDATLSAGATILLSVMIVNMQLSGNEFEHATDVFTDRHSFRSARFFSLAAARFSAASCSVSDSLVDEASGFGAAMLGGRVLSRSNKCFCRGSSTKRSRRAPNAVSSSRN